MEPRQSFLSARIWRERLLPGAVFIAVFYEFTYYLIRDMLPESLSRLCLAALPAALVCEGLLLLGVVLGGEWKRSLLLFNLCWLIVSRCLLGDLGFPAWSAVRWAVLFVCFFHGFSFLSARQRDRLYALVTLELSGLLSLWAVLAVSTAIAGHPTAGIEGVRFSVEHTEPPLVFISFFGLHRNLTSAYFVCAAGMLLYHCRKTRAPFWRGLTALFLPLAFCAVALQHSRSNYLAFAVLLGLALVCSLRQLRGWPQGFAGHATTLCALALSAALLYTGMGAVSDGVTALSRTVRQELSAETGIAGNSGAESKTLAELSDSRNTLADSRTLNGRIEIWRAGLRTIREKPSVALIGQPMESVMTPIQQITGLPHVHMHNALFQQLMTACVPGLAIYCLFFLSLLKRIVSALCHKEDESFPGQQMFSALLLALLIYGVFEPLLCQRIPVPSLLFCLSAGLLCLPRRNGALLRSRRRPQPRRSAASAFPAPPACTDGCRTSP